MLFYSFIVLLAAVNIVYYVTINTDSLRSFIVCVVSSYSTTGQHSMQLQREVIVILWPSSAAMELMSMMLQYMWVLCL